MTLKLSQAAVLAHYFDSIGMDFRMGGAIMTAREVFDNEGFMPLFAHIASTDSAELLGRENDANFAPSETALFGMSIEQSKNHDVLWLLLLLRAAEKIIGRHDGPMTIDLGDVYRYFAMPPDERGEVKPPFPIQGVGN